jgi:hypothetical protein
VAASANGNGHAARTAVPGTVSILAPRRTILPEAVEAAGDRSPAAVGRL